jgi:hypothetical protein
MGLLSSRLVVIKPAPYRDLALRDTGQARFCGAADWGNP